jgi:LAS superfamily LD-carboxypeptidase LdcB
MISLYDEYNSNIPDSSDIYGKPVEAGKQLAFPEETRRNFRNSVEEYLKKQGIIKEEDVEGENYLLVSESSKTEMAQELVDRLKTKDVIEEKENGEILFNDGQESFTLKTKSGRWMCEALDASSFLDPHNLDTSHLVILPEHFRQQQERVWHILITLGFQNTRYHNIFFDEKGNPQDIADRIRKEIEATENTA